jgi:hypothetical protein
MTEGAVRISQVVIAANSSGAAQPPHSRVAPRVGAERGPGLAVALFVRRGVATMPFYRKTEVSDADLAALAAYLTRKR